MREHRQCIGFELRDRTRFSKSLPTLPPLKRYDVTRSNRDPRPRPTADDLAPVKQVKLAGWAGSGRTFEPAPDFQKRKRGHSARSNLSDHNQTGRRLETCLTPANIAHRS
ncbi:hypothetical protein CIHG_02290 [Coccidioides immitis H538.4]|uniref:Uncharacterized protein n=2 Tax=Coccidioides immitis TaxID=5501 RepID=A0A0J8R878_COCIT|nr:hypothetical protein CISG_08608 [Coccidioides immitis RMSCC 3703]KMU84505.1 hypothetical protein CIHG_02290 [Coccidioides immitis H538.4]